MFIIQVAENTSDVQMYEILEGSDLQPYAFISVFDIFLSTTVETNEELIGFSVKCGCFIVQRTRIGYVRKVKRF